MSWEQFALCGKADNPDDWDMGAFPFQRERAVATCMVCPVYAECLTAAQRRPPTDLIQAAFGWRYPSMEPVNPMTGRRLGRKQRPRRATKVHGYSGYANGCKCPICKQGKRDYVASRKSA